MGRAWWSSIRIKAIGVVFGVAGALVVFLSVYFAERQVAAIQAGLRDKAATYARLVSRQVESGVAFDDRETVREVFTATAEDRDVAALALFDAEGHRLFATGETRIERPRNVERVELSSVPGAIRATAPVVSREGPRGTLVLDITTARLVTERRAVEHTARAVGVVALAAGFLAAWVIARSLGRRLGAIAAATRAVAGGDLSVAALEDPSADEVGQLARAFNAMSANLRELLQRIRDAGARETERLDALVRARTDELDARNRDLRLVLDNVSQGLLVLDRQGRPGTEQSAVVERWFGKAAAGATFWELIAPLDRRASLDFQLNWDQLLEGCLPTELAVEQLPRTLRTGVLEYQLEYTPLLADGEAVERVLVVISDVTERRLAERTQAEQYEIVRSFERLSKDRTGFLEFMSDAAALVDRLCSVGPRPLADVRRWLHTLKGNASLFGLIRLATFCHELEDQIEDTGEDLSDAASDALRAQWDGFAVRIESLMGETKQAAVALGDAEYQAFFEALSAGRPRHELARMVAEWKLEPASERLARHASQARSLLRRLGNGGVDVSVDGGRVRLSREAMAPFWGVFGHAVRNAIAHGLELPGERVVLGKRGTGSLRLRAAREGERVIIEIGDDGRGIDWERVRERARAAGIPAETSADLHAALFHDGLSTKDAVDGEAGRGIGMGALRAECDRLGGRVNVTSQLGRGTTLRFVFPADRVAENEETRLSCVTALRPTAGEAMETGRIASGA